MIPSFGHLRRAAATSLTILVMLVAPTASTARTWIVWQPVDSQPTGTIQDAIDSAGVSDVILVYPGVYDESIDFKGKSLRIYSVDGPLTTVIDGGGRQVPVVTCSKGEDRDTILEGFTIQNGRGFREDGVPHHGGGGIFIVDAEPTIRKNVIANNATAGAGGGIYCAGTPGTGPWRPEISENTITLNRAMTQGGGIYCVNRLIPLITRNVLEANEVTGDGAAMSLRLTVSGARVLENRIIDNLAGDHAGGIVVVNAATQPPISAEVAWNLIARNTAQLSSSTSESGAGIWVGDVDGWIHHNTIVLNVSESGSGGGGISVIAGGEPLIERNILTQNGGGSIFCNVGGNARIQDNLFWDNVPDESSPCGELTSLNLFQDPLFCDPSSEDFSLAANSVALTHALAPLGAFATAGCGPTSVRKTTWGRLKLELGRK